MPKYKVEVMEQVISKYLVEACSEKSAIQKANKGEGDLINSLSMGVNKEDRENFVSIEEVEE